MKQYVNLETIDMFKNKSIEIMPLTVLTGVNGSGKTTILKAIEDQFCNTKHYKWTGLSIFKEYFEGEKGDILLFEQPEVGLHPKFQLALADVILAYAQAGRTVVVETHSDHIINRLTRRFIEKQEVRNILKIYFLKHEADLEQNVLEITNIHIDDVDGCICDDKDFFYQFADETAEIMSIGYKNLQKKCKDKQSSIEEIKIDREKGIFDEPKEFFPEFASETMEIVSASVHNRNGEYNL